MTVSSARRPGEHRDRLDEQAVRLRIFSDGNRGDHGIAPRIDHRYVVADEICDVDSIAVRRDREPRGCGTHCDGGNNDGVRSRVDHGHKSRIAQREVGDVEFASVRRDRDVERIRKAEDGGG